MDTYHSKACFIYRSLGFQNGMAFTTKDRDNDIHSSLNCALIYPGGWWYKKCVRSNLNGEYFYTQNPRGTWNGIYWDSWKGNLYSLKSAEMMLRRI